MGAKEDKLMLTEHEETDQQNEFLSENKNNKKNGKKKKEKEPQAPVISLIALYKFADRLDTVMITVGLFMSILVGALSPLVCVLFGSVTDTFVAHGASMKANSTNFTNVTTIDENIQQKMTRFSIVYCVIALLILVATYLQISLLTVAAGRQVQRIRKLCFHHIMQKDIGWFDVNDTRELNTRLTDDIYKIEEGIGDKVGMLTVQYSTFIFSLIIAFTRGWKLTLVNLAVSPLTATSFALFATVLTTFATKEQAAYAKAGAVAEEVLSSIRTVFAFSGQERELKRYEKHLQAAKSVGIKKAVCANSSIGFVMCITFCTYGLAFWYGSTLILSGQDSIGNVVGVFLVVSLGVMSIGQSSSYAESVASARGAAHKVYHLIDHKPSIDSFSEDGFKPDFIRGDIEFRNIHFSYPSRPNVKILDNMSLCVNSGQTIALVGSSGCGKSTTVQLLQRFYDPQEGSVFIDGHDIRSLNIRYLREMIGVVSQEPILFATTIAENIRYGRLDVTQHEIEQAAREANAYDFIMNLPNRFETEVGDRGAQMSGGQKQRIAIARALVRNPKILLLDEATSALDAESERMVQAALDKVRLGRTTIIVAHRLSTIRNADVIAAFQDSKVKEVGTHSQLMEKQGVYHSLVTTQRFQSVEEKVDTEYEESTDEESALSSYGSLHRRKSSSCSSVISSVGKEGGTDKTVTEEEETVKPVSFFKVLRLNGSEWPYILGGFLCSILLGAIYPFFSVLTSAIIAVFQEPDPETIRHQTSIICILFAVIGVVSLVTVVMQGFCFGKSGETLTLKLRTQAFKSMMRQDLGWYDNPRNSVGALTTRLATHAAQVQGATGVRLGTLAQNFSTFGITLILSLVCSWEMTFLIVAAIPLMVISNQISAKEMAAYASETKKQLENAGKVACEAIENIRTVASLAREPQFEQLYEENLIVPYMNAKRKACTYGLSFSVSQTIGYFITAACFRLAAWLIDEGRIEVGQIFLVIMTLMFGTLALSSTSGFTPDYAKGKTSASYLLSLINLEPAIDNLSREGETLEKLTGNIHFKRIKFNYPARPDLPVLRGLDLQVKKGQTMALVGSSGCGKSTVIQLMERFYDPLRGRVVVDGVDVKNLNLAWLRSQIGIVSQEPMLFDCSLAENIAYGDNSRTVTMEEIEAAAKAANIHSFIMDLPQKYDTQAGDKGAQLSGGQKQRVAIARAILRNPKLLLLDEATSALDSESEKVVQEALDRASKGRTCIVVAHRLSTIKNADCIAVLQGGVVVEQGTHQQLLAKKGVYHMLVTAQLGHGTE